MLFLGLSIFFQVSLKFNCNDLNDRIIIELLVNFLSLQYIKYYNKIMNFMNELTIYFFKLIIIEVMEVTFFNF